MQGAKIFPCSDVLQSICFRYPPLLDYDAVMISSLAGVGFPDTE